MRKSPSYLVPAALAAAIALTVVIYWPGLNGPFLLDDTNNLSPAVVDSLALDTLAPAVFSNHSGPLGRPVAAFTFALNSYFSGLDAFAFKYTNLLIHLINGLLLFWLGGYLLSRIVDQGDRRRAWIVAGIAAFFWMVHPLNVSTVLYVVQRMTQLSTLFTLASLLCYAIGRQRIIDNVRGGIHIMTVGLLLFGPLAVLSKENGALIPLFIVLIESLIFRLKTPGERSRKQLLIFLLLFCGLPLVIGFLYFVSNYQALLAGYDNRSFSLSERLLTESQVLFFYIRLILLPRLAAMGLFQDDFGIVSQIDLLTALAITGLTSLVMIVILARKRAPVLAFGIGWFLVAHLMESTIFPLEPVFEHRNYLASYGLLLPVAFYLIRLTAGFRWPASHYVISASIVVLFSWMTAVRAFTWSNEELLLTISVENHPASQRAHAAVADHYFRYLILADGRRHLETAMDITPLDPGPVIHLLYSYCNAASVPEEPLQRAIELLKTGIISAYAIQALNTLQEMQTNDRCGAMTTGTAVRLTESALRNPRRAYQTQRLYLHARMLAKDGDKESAAEYYRATFERTPHGPINIRVPALMYLTKLLIEEKRYEDAYEAINKLIKMDRSFKINYKKGISDLKMLLAQHLEKDGLLAD